MFYLDSTLLLLIPPILLSLFAQWKVKSTFDKYSNMSVQRGLSGAQTAVAMANAEQVPVSVVPGQGYLSDHFNPTTNSLVLSPEVYSGHSISSVGVAAHELGHAIQKKDGYWPMYLRSGLVPLANFGTQFSWILFIGGMFASIEWMQTAGIVLFAAAVLFTLITLPVEFDASNRALKLLRRHNIVSEREAPHVKKVLNAAALTYVAAAVMAIAQLIRLILISRTDD